MSETKYSSLDKIFAIVCFVLGYAFIHLCFLVGRGIGVCIVAVAVLLTELLYFIFSRSQKLSGRAIGAFAVAFILSFGFAFISAPQILFLNFSLVVLAETYILSLSFNTTVSQNGVDFLFFDLIKSVFVIPFANFAHIWPAAFSKKRDGEGKKSGGSALLGLAIAFVPVCIIIALLLSADVAFSVVLKAIFNFSFFDVFEELFYIGLSIPVAMYLFGVLYGNGQNPMPNSITAENVKSFTSKAKVFPRVTMIASLVPIVLIYVAFFASQCVYFISAFWDMLPKNFSVSQYARKGFFELCAICVINFAIICFVGLFAEKQGDRESRFLRVLKAIICVCTEAFVVIDIAKMLLYIERFGLTRKRVITSWFMVVLGILFLIILAKQIFVKFKITLPAVCVCVFMSLLLIFSNVDGLIAKHNVNMYLTGKTVNMDILMFYDLDDSVVKYVLPLTEDDDESVKQRAIGFIASRKSDLNDKDWNEYTIYTYEAKYLLENVDY